VFRFSLQLLSKTFLILSRTERDIYHQSTEIFIIKVQRYYHQSTEIVSSKYRDIIIKVQEYYHQSTGILSPKYMDIITKVQGYYHQSKGYYHQSTWILSKYRHIVIKIQGYYHQSTGILSSKYRDIIIKVQRYCHQSTQVFMCRTVIIVRFQWKLNFLNRLSKNTQISNSMKIVRWEPSSMRTDGQTGITTLKSRVSQFCEHASKRTYSLSRGYGMSIKTGYNGALVCRDRSMQSGVRLYGPFRL
jgi:hypothetical protein